MKNIPISDVNFSGNSTSFTLNNTNQTFSLKSIPLDSWIVTSFIVGIALRLYRLGEAPFWLDETFTAIWVKLPWREMLSAVFSDNHLPLYFVLLKAWSAIAGTSEIALRAPNVFFSMLTIPLVAAIAWAIKDLIAARWAAWLATLSPYFLQHAQEARMYPLLGLLAATNTLLLLRFLKGNDKSLTVWFFAMNAAILSTHYYGIFFVGAEFLVLLALGRNRWRSWTPMMGLSLAFIIAPMLSAKYLATPHAGGSYGIGIIALPGLIWSLIGGYTLLPTSIQLHEQGARAVLPYIPVASVTAAALMVIGFAAYRSISKSDLIALAIITCTIIFAPFAVGIFFDVGVNPRYAIACVPAVLGFIAAGCPNATRQYAREFSTMGLFAIVIAASFFHLENPSHGREDVVTIGEWLDKNVANSENIFVTSAEMKALATFHWPHRHFTLYPGRKVIVDRTNVNQIVNELPIPTAKRLIYIFGRTWVSDPDNALRKTLKDRYSECGGTMAEGVTVLCLTIPRR